MKRNQPSFVERTRAEDDPRCGTASGFSRHQASGEKPCERCCVAKSEYDRRRLSADDKTRRNRLHAKAQQKALKDLRTAHPAEYRALYLAHKENLLREVTATT